MNSDYDDWMQTYSGGAFFIRDSHRKSHIDIGDIAMSLSRLPRFLGHSSDFLSVASHSLAVASLFEQEFGPGDGVLYALLHDAHEAYTGDIPSPIKKAIPAIRTLQEIFQLRIYQELNIPRPSEATIEAVKMMDLKALKIERDLFCKSDLVWNVDALGIKGDYKHLYVDHYNGGCDAFLREYCSLREFL